MELASRAVITTHSGREFDYNSPETCEFHIEDIAHALARMCRFGGHVRSYYSVAEHSVRVSHLCRRETALAGLLHDAAEAYLGDVVAPLKKMPEMIGYRLVEQRVEAALGRAFGVELTPMHVEVAIHDATMCATEQRDIRDIGREHDPTKVGAAPLPERLRPWSIERAEVSFLERFRWLQQRRREGF